MFYGTQVDNMLLERIGFVGGWSNPSGCRAEPWHCSNSARMSCLCSPISLESRDTEGTATHRFR